MSNRATTTAKGRPKKSYARGKSRKEDPEAMILWMPDETFCEEMSEWVDSPEGQLWLDMSNTRGSAEARGPRCPTTQIPLA